MNRSTLSGTLDCSRALAAQTLVTDASPRTLRGRSDGVRVAIEGRFRFATTAIDSAGDGDGDGDAIAAAYHAHGMAFFESLHGTFALVIADERNGEVVLAVDRLGIETLCYGTVGTRLIYSTDAGRVADGLLDGRAQDLSVHGGLDPQAIFDYLYFHCIPGPTTVYRGVARLLPGHALRFVAGRATLVPYWQPAYVEDAEGALATLEAAFLRTVEQSVGSAIAGAVRPGAFLSGGTDSSTVAGMLGRVTGAPANTYSIGFDAEGFDEMSYARIASKHFGTRHHEFYITPPDLVRSIPDIASRYDQPFGNSSVLPTYYCAKLAVDDGVDRLLGGDGGDELFGGNTRYAKQRVFDTFDRTPRFVQGLARSALGPAAWNAVPLVRKAASYVRQASVPMPDRMQTYNLLGRIGVENIFEPAFLATVDVDGPMKAMRDWYARSSQAGFLNRMLAFDLKYTLTDNDLPKVVTACRAAGVEVAFPLLDDRLVAFAARLDPGLKLKGLKLRWFFKHALRDFLPAEIITKKKHGFGLPFGIWLGRDRALNELAFASLDALKSRGIVRHAFIDQLRADLLADHATYYGELVWVLMMLEQWLSTHRVGPRG